jgi:hypothetical protein
MPTILELFKSSKETKQIPQPKATSYIADPGQFLIDRENKLGNSIEKRFDPLRETALEQELSGLRPMRLVNSPTLYGTDIIRITTQKTSDVDAMKLSKNPNQQISLGKIGRFLEKTTNFVNKTLGIPQNVFPTYVINTKEFKEGKTPNKMITLGDIRKDARGTALGRFLKETGAGTPSQLAKQTFGKGINLAKTAIRTALIGDRIIPVTSGSLDNFNQKYFENEFNGTYSDSMKDLTLPDSIQSFDISRVSPIFGLDRQSTDGYPGLFGTPRRFANRDANYGFQLSSGTANQKAGEPTQIELINKFNTPDKKYSTGSASNSFNDEAQKNKFQNNPILDFIKPVSLKRSNWKKDRYSTDNTTKSYHNGGETIYNNRLDSRRGLHTDRDVINQTGRLAAGEVANLKYNGKTLDELDLIPLKFQRVNDNAVVYFRSIISGFNEQFSPSWESSRMLGSPFNFYNYTSIERKLTFNLKVYAMSQAELVMMWRRLEFLAHCTYPYQYNQGIIEPTLLYFTLGSVYNKKACFLDSLSYSIEDSENLWEIGGGLLKTKEGTFESTFNNTFYATQLNGQENSRENGVGASVSETKLNVAGASTGVYTTKSDRVKEGEVKLYDDKLKVSNIQETNRNIKVSQGNYNMDNYKLPKFINASIGLTFIETKNTTDYNIYGYGKKIE